MGSVVFVKDRVTHSLKAPCQRLDEPSLLMRGSICIRGVEGCRLLWWRRLQKVDIVDVNLLRS
jgi:hypothetical protein